MDAAAIINSKGCKALEKITALSLPSARQLESGFK
jgi:hypothetical protein